MYGGRVVHVKLCGVRSIRCLLSVGVTLRVNAFCALFRNVYFGTSLSHSLYRQRAMIVDRSVKTLFN